MPLGRGQAPQPIMAVSIVVEQDTITIIPQMLAKRIFRVVSHTCTHNLNAASSSTTRSNMPKANNIPCQAHYTNDPDIYTAYTLEGRTYKPPLNLIAANYLCENRGSLGGKGGYSKNVGAFKLEKCAEFVSTNSKCGPFFSYGLKDGYCDCVPVNKGQCKLFTDAGTQTSQYSAYSMVAKKVTIGSNNGGLQTKCVDNAGMACASNAGNRGIRINGDNKDAGDAFKITTSASQVCTKRVNACKWSKKLGFELAAGVHLQK